MAMGRVLLGSTTRFHLGYNTRKEAIELLAFAEEFHIEGLREAGLPISEPMQR